MSHTLQALRRSYAGDLVPWVAKQHIMPCKGEGTAPSAFAQLAVCCLLAGSALASAPSASCHVLLSKQTCCCDPAIAVPLPASAVIAISSLDRKTGCFSFWDDCFDVAEIIQEWRSDWG